MPVIADIMPARIDATVIAGLGMASGRHVGDAARGSYVLQKPYLMHYLPQLATCFDGTINLLLDIPVQVGLPNIVTPPIHWNPEDPAFDERFGFTSIRFSLDDKEVPAWIYTPERSPHRCKLGMIEILCEPLDGVAPGRRCAVVFPRVAKPSQVFV